MVTGATSFASGTRRLVPVTAPYVGMSRQRKEVVSQATPYLNGRKARDLKSKPYVIGERQGVPVRAPYMGISRQKNSGVRSHVVCGGSKTEFQ